MALLNSMCLHDVLCDSLGLAKFDIEFMVSYFFEIRLLFDFEMSYALFGVAIESCSCL